MGSTGKVRRPRTHILWLESFWAIKFPGADSIHAYPVNAYTR